MLIKETKIQYGFVDDSMTKMCSPISLWISQPQKI